MTFDFSPSSTRDRWAGRQRALEKVLTLLDSPPADGRRLRYLALDPQEEAVWAGRGAAAASA